MATPFYLSEKWKENKDTFYSSFYNKTVTAVSSTWNLYAGYYLINVWDLTIGGIVNKLWDTNPYGMTIRILGINFQFLIGKWID